MEEEFYLMLGMSLAAIILEIIIFLILVVIGRAIYKRIPKIENRILNPKEYLPEDEIHTLKQVYYLILMAACFICILYTLISQGTNYYYIAVLDIIISLWIAITSKKDTWFRKLATVLIIPFGSMTFILLGYSIIGLMDIIHIPIMIYFIKYYYGLFKEYTEANSLGITILLLFSIVFISAINTTFVESKNPLDALVMVSNAFTSNGYTVLGDSVAGKLNSIILVWAGFIISGVGTATLTFALSQRYYSKKFEDLEESIKNLEESIKNNKE